MKKVVLFLMMVLVFFSFQSIQGQDAEVQDAEVQDAEVQYEGTNLRGQLLTKNKYGEFPSQGAKVELYVHREDKWKPADTSFTDTHGYYYFNLIAPDSNYAIKINDKDIYAIEVRIIDYSQYRFQNLGKIILD